jgi:hypothetical protein
VTISCQDYAPSRLVPNAAYENCNLWMNAYKGASFLPHVSRFDSVDTGRANELYFSNQHPLKPVTAFRHRPLIACTGILAFRSGNHDSQITSERCRYGPLALAATDNATHVDGRGESFLWLGCLIRDILCHFPQSLAKLFSLNFFF